MDDASQGEGKLRGCRASQRLTMPQRLEGVSETGWRLGVWETSENIRSASEHWVSQGIEDI